MAKKDLAPARRRMKDATKKSKRKDGKVAACSTTQWERISNYLQSLGNLENRLKGAQAEFGAYLASVRDGSGLPESHTGVEIDLDNQCLVFYAEEQTQVPAPPPPVTPAEMPNGAE